MKYIGIDKNRKQIVVYSDFSGANCSGAVAVDVESPGSNYTLKTNYRKFSGVDQWCLTNETKEKISNAKACLGLLQTSFNAFVSALNNKYANLDIDPNEDHDEDSILMKCLSCTAPDGSTGMSANDASALDWYAHKLKRIKRNKQSLIAEKS